MQDVIRSLLSYTASRMDPPVLFGCFHALASGITVLAAVLLAFLVSATLRKPSAEGRHFPKSGSGTGDSLIISHDYGNLIRVLAVCGWILLIMELFKQLFLFYIVNDGKYDWWYFPFQLCSVPMYLCILLPAVRRQLREAFLTFMTGYTFLSAAAALAYPQDFLRSYAALTAHGFIWHGILLLISLTIAMSGLADLSMRGFGRATLLFLLLCTAAIGINAAIDLCILADPAAAGRYTNTYPAMFYLDPFHISPQPIVSTVQQAIGQPAGIAVGLALYICAIIAAVGICTALLRRLSGRSV